MLPTARTIILWVSLVTGVVVLQVPDVSSHDFSVATTTDIFPFDPSHSWRRCGPCRCVDTNVDCSGERLTSVPSPAGGLPPDATSLCLRDNSISSLGPGVFAHLPSLHWLDLSNNTITSISSAAFRGLVGLKRLNLSDNLLTLINDTACSDRPFIEPVTHLDLSHNHLHNVSCSIVDEVGAFELQWLKLSHNDYSLNGEAPRLLRNLKNLTFLDLSHNNLTYLQRALFEGAPGIHSLNLSHNDIPLNWEAYSPDAFRVLEMSLAELRLEGNCDASSSPLRNLSYPVQALFGLSRLEVLRMDGLPDAKFQSDFQSMTSLTSLSLSGLDESFCTMNSLRNDTFTWLPASLRFLNLSDCNVSEIDTEAFGPLRSVHTLDLSSNPQLGFDSLGNAVCALEGSDLRELQINFIVPSYAMCVMVTAHHTRCFNRTRLESIHARDNRIELFCEGALNTFPRTLKFVSLDQNRVNFGSYFKDLSSLVSLEEIHNDGNKYASIPPTAYPSDNQQLCAARMNADLSESETTCGRSGQQEDFSVTTRHSNVEPSKRHVPSHVYQPYKLVFTLPPNLTTYVSRWNKLYYHILEVEFNANNSLETLDLSNNLLTRWTGPITGLKKLRTLDLANNLAYEICPHFFETLSSLRVLNMSRNHLKHMYERNIRVEIFQPLSQLDYLDLGKCDLFSLTGNVFNGLGNLRTLVLSFNDLYSFNVNISHMKNLSLLDLSYNNLRYLPQHVMDHLDNVAEYQQVSVNLSHNPIECLCSQIHFLMWIQSSKIYFSHSDDYSCILSDGSYVKTTNIYYEIQRLQTTCIDKVGILIGSVVCAFFLLVVLVGALIYRFRWKIRYLYYASRLAYRRIDSSSSDDHFEYDAFVSYSSDNNDFVQGELLDELETRAGLRLNVHSRDFTPGMPIPTNIVGAVHNSRRTLVVLTRALLESDWCYYELQMATMEASYTGRDVLVFLLYEDVPTHQLPREMLYNLQASTYINYPGANEDPSLARDFWLRLAQALRQ